jgi:hypothetical protein
MKRLLVTLPACILFFLLSVKTSATANNSPHKWHSGTVVMLSGDTIRANVYFTRKVAEGLLQVRKGNQIRILTVKDVISFSYFDENKNSERKFITVSLQPEQSTRSHEIFIELVYSNEQMAILNHKTLGFDNRKIQFNPFRKKIIVNNRYLLDNLSGKVLPMSKENALELMENEKKEILYYIQSNGVRLKTVEDFMALLDFHQSLLKTDS